jgi:hypothetical protein
VPEPLIVTNLLVKISFDEKLIVTWVDVCVVPVIV